MAGGTASLNDTDSQFVHAAREDHAQLSALFNAKLAAGGTTRKNTPFCMPVTSCAALKEWRSADTALNKANPKGGWR